MQTADGSEMPKSNQPGSRLLRVAALVCVFLVSFGASVQAIHVHTQNSRLTSHECSLCLVAHSGVLSGVTSPPDPVFHHTALVIPQADELRSSGFVFSLCIRPPPSV